MQNYPINFVFRIKRMPVKGVTKQFLSRKSQSKIVFIIFQ